MNLVFTKNPNRIYTRNLDEPLINSIIERTSFFPSTVTLKTRIYAILNGQYSLPCCAKCGATMMPGLIDIADGLEPDMKIIDIYDPVSGNINGYRVYDAGHVIQG
jgi:hypothetical protein